PGTILTHRLAGAGRMAIDMGAYATPMRRIGSPAEVADAVLWLCSPASGFITGAVIAVHGGQAAGPKPAPSAPPSSANPPGPGPLASGRDPAVTDPQLRVAGITATGTTSSTRRQSAASPRPGASLAQRCPAASPESRHLPTTRPRSQHETKRECHQLLLAR